MTLENPTHRQNSFLVVLWFLGTILSTPFFTIVQSNTERKFANEDDSTPESSSKTHSSE